MPTSGPRPRSGRSATCRGTSVPVAVGSGAHATDSTRLVAHPPSSDVTSAPRRGWHAVGCRGGARLTVSSTSQNRARMRSCEIGRKELPLRICDALVVLLFSVSANPAAGPAAQTKAAMLEGTTWQLTTLPGHPSADLAALQRRVTLRLAEGRVTGFTGCNVLIG